MADPRDKTTSSQNGSDDDSRVSAIEERIERLRRLHGWGAEPKPATEKVEAVVEALDGDRHRAKQAKSSLVLRFTLPGKPEETVEVTEEHYDIGSGERAKLRVMDPSVSARHCRISRDGDGFRVRDMNTHTGTWVNGERIPLSSPLAHGDVLRCGDINFSVLLKDESGVTAPPPVPPTQAVAPTKVAAQSAPPVAQKAPNASQPALPAEPSKTAMRPAFPRPKTIDGLPAVPSGGGAEASQTAKGDAAKPALSMKEALAAKAAALAARAASNAAAAAAKPPEFPPLPNANEQFGAALVFFDEDGNEAEVEITPEKSLTVGRRSSCDLRLIDSGISSHHAVFEWRGRQFYVRDLGSTNGTWVHGERVDESKLVDQDVVRLGLFPLRVRFYGDLPYEEEIDALPLLPEPEPEPEPEPLPVESVEAAPPWFVLYVNEAGQLASMRLDAYEPSLLVGEGAVDLQLQGRGLKSEHIQFDWLDGQLTVMAARRDAAVKVNGRAINEATLRPGDLVTAGQFQGRVVCGSVLAPVEPALEMVRWAQRLNSRSQDLELLFVDPTVPGGRVELSIWGDGAAQAEQHSVGAHEPRIMPLDVSLSNVLIEALITAGFPVQPELEGANGTELHGFWGEERASVQLGESLPEDWAFICELLRSVVDLLLA